MPLLKYEFSYKKSDERAKRCIERAWIYADAEGLWEISMKSGYNKDSYKFGPFAINSGKTGVPVKSTVFLWGLVYEVAWGGGTRGGGSETHCISVILSISARVLPEMH